MTVPHPPRPPQQGPHHGAQQAPFPQQAPFRPGSYRPQGGMPHPPQAYPAQAPYPPHMPLRPPQPPPERVHPAVLAGVVVWRLVVAGCALYGVGDATGWTRNFEALSQLASLVAGLVFVGLLLYPLLTGGRRHEPGSPWLRGATTVLLLLVAGAYFGLMGGDADYLPFEHIVTPLLVLVDWCFVGRSQGRARWWHPLTWIAFPLAYLVYYLAAGLDIYPFLDAGDDGFAGTIAMLLVAVVAVGYLLYGIGLLKEALGRSLRANAAA